MRENRNEWTHKPKIWLYLLPLLVTLVLLAVSISNHLFIHPESWFAHLMRYGLPIGAGLTLHFLVRTYYNNRSLGEIHERLHHLSTALDNSKTSVLIADCDGRVIYVNQRFAETLRLGVDTVIGDHLDITSEEPNAFCSVLLNAMANQSPWMGEVRYRTDDSEIRWDQVAINPVLDKNGQPTHFLCVRYDITPRKQLEARLNVMAYYDSVTGLHNRAYLENHGDSLLMRAHHDQRRLAVFYLDLDDFKKVNDSLGHEAGDLVLQAVATRLTGVLGENDVVMRLGGDEFLAVLQDAQEQSLEQTAQCIIHAVTEPITIYSREVFMGTSVGISVYPKDGDDLPTLMKHADIAMYHAKKRGGNSFDFFELAMSTQAEKTLIMETELHHALDRKEFELHYQPQVNGRTGEIVGVEALLRWNNPERGLISPGEFIPVLEQTGMIVPVGRWVLTQAVSQVVAWEQAGLPRIKMSVNISVRQLKRRDFLQCVEKVLTETGYDRARHCLELEITESTLMDCEDAPTILKTLNERFGIYVAIDDFGTGYSSLSHLKNLPVDTLKIDRVFVKDVTSSTNDKAIAAAIATMGEGLGLRVVSEGVETVEQLEFLSRYDGMDIQGYLFSRPLPVTEVEHLLRQRTLQIPAKLQAAG